MNIEGIQTEHLLLCLNRRDDRMPQFDLDIQSMIETQVAKLVDAVNTREHPVFVGNINAPRQIVIAVLLHDVILFVDVKHFTNRRSQHDSDHQRNDRLLQRLQLKSQTTCFSGVTVFYVLRRTDEWV